MDEAGHVLLGRIGRPHGVKGDVRVQAFTADPLAISGYGPLLDGRGGTLKIERARPDKGTMIVARFAGINDRDAAEALNGTGLYVERSRLPAAEPDEFYHADLIGLAAVSGTGETLGTVVAVHDFGAGDLLEIATPGGPSLLLPFTTATVPDIDLAAGRLVVVPPEETEARGEEA